MSPKLARLSGSKVATVLGKFGFSVVSQRGSHAKLGRTGPIGEKQICALLEIKVPPAINRRICSQGRSTSWRSITF